jgi:hypothetical protein
MELLGNRNWWAPAWLVRLLPAIRVEPAQKLPGESEPERAPARV